MDLKALKSLIDFIAKSELEEVNIETEALKLAVKKTSPTLTLQSPSPTKAHESTPAPHSQATVPVTTNRHEATAQDSIPIKSPMVGTFYQAANPEAAPFVQVGDTIQPGQTVGMIEAMKLFNEIEAEVAGKIVKVLVENASPVEYDQPLFLIDPA